MGVEDDGISNGDCDGCGGDCERVTGPVGTVVSEDLHGVLAESGSA